MNGNKLLQELKELNEKAKDLRYRTEQPLAYYLSKLEKISLSKFLLSRRTGLQAIDKLRLFYYAQYKAKQEII